MRLGLVHLLLLLMCRDCRVMKNLLILPLFHFFLEFAFKSLILFSFCSYASRHPPGLCSRTPMGDFHPPDYGTLWKCANEYLHNEMHVFGALWYIFFSLPATVPGEILALKYTKNTFVDGALTQTPLGTSRRSPRLPSRPGRRISLSQTPPLQWSNYIEVRMCQAPLLLFMAPSLSKNSGVQRGPPKTPSHLANCCIGQH